MRGSFPAFGGRRFSRTAPWDPFRIFLCIPIDLSDQTFSVNFLPDLERLRSSIQEVGLIHPVLLREKSNGYQIVSGFRRTWPLFRSLVHHRDRIENPRGRELEDLKLFFISLHENLTSRGFNTVEKAIALEKLVDHFRVDPVGGHPGDVCLSSISKRMKRY